MFSIVSLNTLNQTGPAVFALLVLRAFRAPKGVLSLTIPPSSLYHVMTLIVMAWSAGMIRDCYRRYCVMHNNSFVPISGYNSAALNHCF